MLHDKIMTPKITHYGDLNICGGNMMLKPSDKLVMVNFANIIIIVRKHLADIKRETCHVISASLNEVETVDAETYGGNVAGN